MPRTDKATYQRILAAAAEGTDLSAEAQAGFAQKLLSGLREKGVRNLADAMAMAGLDPAAEAEAEAEDKPDAA